MSKDAGEHESVARGCCRKTLPAGQASMEENVNWVTKFFVVMKGVVEMHVLSIA